MEIFLKEKYDGDMIYSKSLTKGVIAEFTKYEKEFKSLSILRKIRLSTDGIVVISLKEVSALILKANKANIELAKLEKFHAQFKKQLLKRKKVVSLSDI
jgi:hypothetical protein